MELLYSISLLNLYVKESKGRNQVEVWDEEWHL